MSIKTKGSKEVTMKVSDYLGFLKSSFDLESKSVEYGAKTVISKES